MRIAFVSDIHSNLEALETTLDDLKAEEIYCLGDIVGYGASPNQVISLLRSRNVKCVMGNHDFAVVTGELGEFNGRAAAAILWTRRELTQQNMDFLKRLPSEIRFKTAGLLFYATHGSPDDRLWEYVDPWTHSGVFGRFLDKTGSDVLALGHTHIPYTWQESGKTVLNPGSVGQPRDGDWRASYAVVDVSNGTVNVRHSRVEYDVEGAVSKILNAGLPPQLALRLKEGL